MWKKVLVDLDMNLNQLLNLVFQISQNDLTSWVSWQVFFNDTEKKLKVYDWATFKSILTQADKLLFEAKDTELLWKITSIETLLASDDVDLDDMKELVAFIKANKTELENLSVSNIAWLQDSLDDMQIELQKSSTHIQWRRASGSWINLVSIDDLIGPQWEKLNIRVDDSQLQFKYQTESIWTDLFNLNSLKWDSWKNPLFRVDGQKLQYQIVWDAWWIDLYTFPTNVITWNEVSLKPIIYTKSQADLLFNAKLSILDIRDDLLWTAADKALSENQWRILKSLIDDIWLLLSSDDTTLDEIQEIVSYIKQNKSDLQNLWVNNIAGLQDLLNLKSNSNHNHDWIYEPKKSSDDNYVTDAEKTVIGNTSGTNTGDQDLSTYSTLTGTETLTNKTLTSPVVNTPTGIVKWDVWLWNVDNTSDTTKNSATATLINKTLTSPKINLGSDATGDIYYRNASGLFTRLPIGTVGQVLTASGIPSWADASEWGSSMLKHKFTAPWTWNNEVTGINQVSVDTTDMTGGIVDVQIDWVSKKTFLPNERWIYINEGSTDIDIIAGGGLGLSSYDSVSRGWPNTFMRSLRFKPDGTRLYLLSASGSRTVYEYVLSTPWNLATAYNSNRSFNTLSQENNPTWIFFKPDGTVMYVAGVTNKKIHQYSLSNAWEIHTASYSWISFNVSTPELNPYSMFFKSDWTKMYTIGTSQKVHQYTLSTAWNVSTASYDSVSFNIASQDISPWGMFINDDWSSMYMAWAVNSSLYKYTFSTNWDVSTLSYTWESFNISSQETNIRSVWFKTDESKMYIMGTQNNAVYQYTAGLSFTGEAFTTII